MSQRKNEAKWIESLQRWQINVQADGERKTFVSDKEFSQPDNKKGKIQAEKKSDKWLDEHMVGENTRVEKMYDKFIQNLKDRNTSYGYWHPYESMGNKWVKPTIGTKKIGKLREIDLENVLQEAFDEGSAERYLLNIKVCLNAFLKYCRKCRATKLNPEEIKIPNGAPKSDKGSLQPDEIKILFTSNITRYRGKVIEDIYVHLYRTLVLMGHRPGEAIAFNKKRDIKDGYITVNEAFNENNELTDGKNDNAHRRKKIDALTQNELDEQAAMLKRFGIISPLVFPSPSGIYVTQNYLLKAWKRYCVYNGIGQRGKQRRSDNDRFITLYELRHTHESVNKDMPDGLKKLSMGWSESFDGDSVYSHELDGDLEKIAQFTEQSFKAILGDGGTH